MNNYLKYSFLLITIGMFFTVRSFAQEKKIDSLKNALASAKEDTAKLTILFQLVENILDDKVWPKYNEQAYQFALKLSVDPNPAIQKKGKKGLADALSNKGYITRQEGHVKEAIDYYNKSLQLFQEINDKRSTAEMYINLGYVCDQQGQTHEALEYYGKSLKIFEGLNDKQNIATAFNNIAYIYDSQGQTAEALEYFNKSLKIREEINDKQGIAFSLSNIGVVYDGQGRSELALDFYKRSLKIRKEINDVEGIATSLSNIGYISLKQKQYDIALEYFRKSLAIRKGIKESQGIANSLSNIGTVFFKLKKTALAKQYADSALTVAHTLGFIENIRNTEELLAMIDSALQDFKGSFGHYKQFIIYKDSITNQRTKKESIKKQMQYEFDKEQAADSIKNAERSKQESIKHEQEIKQQRIYTYGGAIGFLLMIIVAGVSFNAYLQKQKANDIITQQKELVEEKQKEILDSIKYAKRIQQSLLPTKKYIENSLKRLKG